MQSTMPPGQSIDQEHQTSKPRGGVRVTPPLPAGPRRWTSSGTPPRGSRRMRRPNTWRPVPLRILLMKSHLDVTLVSDLRCVQVQIDGLRSMLREGFTIRPEQIALLSKASTDLAKTIAEVSAWTEEIRAERFAKTTASMKASLTRSLRPPLIRRRRR